MRKSLRPLLMLVGSLSFVNACDSNKVDFTPPTLPSATSDPFTDAEMYGSYILLSVSGIALPLPATTNLTTPSTTLLTPYLIKEILTLNADGTWSVTDTYRGPDASGVVQNVDVSTTSNTAAKLTWATAADRSGINLTVVNGTQTTTFVLKVTLPTVSVRFTGGLLYNFQKQ